MAVKSLPETVTKELLFLRAQERFAHWAKLYGDSYVSAQYMYEDMACSVFSGDPADDFSVSGVIRYQYKDGSCSFIVDDIEVEVLDLRSMRESSRVNKETYVDVCTLSISYTDEDGNYMYHIVPNAWLYGSTSDSFDEGKPVHEEFIKAARKYIKEHGITKEMQEVQ